MDAQAKLNLACANGQATRAAGLPATENARPEGSDEWLAWRAGWQIAGMSSVRSCRVLRGLKTRVTTAGGARVLVAFAGPNLETITITREG